MKLALCHERCITQVVSWVTYVPYATVHLLETCYNNKWVVQDARRLREFFIASHIVRQALNSFHNLQMNFLSEYKYYTNNKYFSKNETLHIDA